MFSAATKKVLHTASVRAQQYNHIVIQTEHLLAGLLSDPAIKTLVTNLGSSYEAILQSLDKYLSALPAQTRDPKTLSPNTRPNAFSDQVVQIFNETKIISGDAEIIPLKMLLVLMSNAKNSYAAELLAQNGVSMDDIKRKATQTRPGGKNIKKFCTNLTQRVVDKHTNKIVARDSEIRDIIQTLSRKTKSNALLIGKSGVGKTAIIEGLAHSMVFDNVPSQFKNVNIYALNNAALMASGQGYGETETNMTALLKEIQGDPDAILVVDDIHTLSSEVAMCLGLAMNDNVRCIATTTPEGYKNTVQKIDSLDRLFIKKTIDEPTPRQTLSIAEANIARYETHHNVKYQKDTVQAAIRLAIRFIPDRRMPDKVLDILDQAGANTAIAKTASSEKGPFKVKIADIEKIIAKLTGLPASQLNQTETDKINLLEEDLNKVVMGQEEAARVLAKSIRRARAGLNDPSKPIGSFLFQGPTGVGKTELTQQLAKTLDMKLLRYDMSEYMEKHSVSRLIGAPPGYIGSDQAGLLVDPVRQNPNSIILLDEIEKAHPAIYNILLQIMDHGTLTGNDGKKADFRNAIIILTTNAGSSVIKAPTMGFSEDENESFSHIAEAIKRQFTPEFRNRLDAIVPFNHLSKQTAHKIADKFLGQLSERLKAKNITLEWQGAAKNWLVDKGYNREFGARPMARLIQDSVSNFLADEILGGRLKNGGHVRIEFNAAAANAPLHFIIERKKSKKEQAANQNAPQPPKADIA